MAAALNDKLNWIAQRFDRLERRQDAAECHSDDVVQQLQLLLQWAWQRDEAEKALTDDDDPFVDRRLAGDSPGDQIPTGQQDTHDEQAHTPGVNDSSAQHGGASTPARHVEQTRMQEPNDSSARSRSAHTPEPTTGSNEPCGDHWPPTDELFLWNDEFHKKIIDECNHQDHITAVCIIQGMRLFILKKNKCLVNAISHLCQLCTE